MSYIILTLALVVAVYFGVRYFLLKRALKAVDDELQEVLSGLDENRIVKMPQPDKEMEKLLVTINELLNDTRQKAVSYARRETEIKAQIEYISHDLRTPLTSIQGYLSFIDEEALSDDDREALETIKLKADSLQRLIVQFYELSRLEHDDVSRELRAYDVARLLRESMTAHYGLLSEKGLSVSVSIPARPVEASVDVDALERVFANLLQNAGRYAETELRVTMEESDRGISVMFVNDLDAIDRSEAESLFLPFYQRDPSRTQDSSGLGLTIARRLVEQMGGSLDAQVDSTEGSCFISFTVSLLAESA